MAFFFPKNSFCFTDWHFFYNNFLRYYLRLKYHKHVRKEAGAFFFSLWNFFLPLALFRGRVTWYQDFFSQKMLLKVVSLYSIQKVHHGEKKMDGSYIFGLLFLWDIKFPVTASELEIAALKIRKEMMVCVFYDSLILCVSEFEKIVFFGHFLISLYTNVHLCLMSCACLRLVKNSDSPIARCLKIA